MAKKLETKKLVAQLEIVGRKTKKRIWKDMAERIQKPTRHKVTIDVAKLDKLAKKNKGKIMVVPGKVLSTGLFEEKASVVAINASKKAIEKINKNGKFIFLKDFVDEKVKVKELVLVK